MKRAHLAQVPKANAPTTNHPDKVTVTVAEGIAQILRREGVEQVFGIPGGYLLPLLDAFKRCGIRSIESRHECSASFMAAGYTQATGKLSVIFGQSGPGITNMLTGAAAAHMDSVPQLIICSQTFSYDYARDGHQESTGAVRGINQVEAFASISCFSAKPPSANAVARCIRMAISSAYSKKGPALVELPSDLLAAPCEFEDLRPDQYRVISHAIDVQALERIGALLLKAKRPALIAGNRIAKIGAAEALTQMVEKLDVPVCTVDYTKGIVAEDHPLCLGVLGQGGHESVNEYLRQSDLVIAFGTRFNHATSIRFDQALFPNLIQIDEDAVEIGRALPIMDGAAGCLKSSVEFLTASLAPKYNGFRKDLATQVRSLRELHRTYSIQPRAADLGPLKMADVLAVLRRELPRETVAVSDTGLTAIMMKRHFPIYSQDGFYALYALAAMGSGLPLALGVQAARPADTVVSIIGDGGFLVHASELSCAAQFGLPVLTVVLKNNSYRSVGSREEEWFGHQYGTTIVNGDYAKVAEGFNCLGYNCTNETQIAQAVKDFLLKRRPAVIAVDVDPSETLVSTMQPKMKSMLDGLWSKAPKAWPFKS